MTTSAQPQVAESTTATVGGGAPDAAEQKQSKTALAIGTLPENIKHALAFKRQQNIVAAEIIGTNWGKGLDRETRFRIAEWSAQVGIDPAIELDVLGGTFYKNAKFYIRRQAELMAQGVIEYAYAEHVEVSIELANMAARVDGPPGQKEWAIEEIDRRARQRILFNIPAKAESAVVWHVKVRTVPVEFAAAKWCGGGTRKKDPVGDDFPVETSETRAARRCMRLLADWNPSLKSLVEPNDDDTIDAMIGTDLREGLRRAREDAERALAQARGSSILQLQEGDPYGLDGFTPSSVVKDTVPAKPPTVEATRIPPVPIRSSEPEPTDVDTSTGGLGASTEPQNDLDLLSPEERAEHERKSRK